MVKIKRSPNCWIEYLIDENVRYVKNKKSCVWLILEENI
jgi:hypothetical protein